MIELLVEASIRTLLVAGLTGSLLGLFRFRSPAFRHLCWSLVLVAMLAMPVLVRLTPQVQLLTVELPIESAGRIPTIVAETMATPQDSGHWGSIAMAGVAVLLLARTLLGYWLGRRLVASARAIPDELLPVKRPGIRYLESSRLSVPLSFGWRQPAILLPQAFRSWQRKKLEIVIAHEHEHIRRHDFAVAILASTARAIHWFNPLAWWLERRLAMLAEQATDDAASGTDRRRYARVLLDVAGDVGPGRVRALAVAETRGLAGRIERLLDERNYRTVKLKRRTMCVTVFAVTLLAALLGVLDVGRAAAGMIAPTGIQPPAKEVVSALQDQPAAQEEPSQEEEQTPAEDAPAEDSEVEREAPLTVGGGVTMPVVLSRVDPEYTEEAREARFEGTVILAVIVRRDGSVEVERIVRGLGFGLDQSAIEALSQWRFRPATRNGEPVDVALNVEVNFNLRDDEPRNDGGDARQD